MVRIAQLFLRPLRRLLCCCSASSPSSFHLFTASSPSTSSKHLHHLHYNKNNNSNHNHSSHSSSHPSGPASCISLACTILWAILLPVCVCLVLAYFSQDLFPSSKKCGWWYHEEPDMTSPVWDNPDYFPVPLQLKQYQVDGENSPAFNPHKVWEMSYSHGVHDGYGSTSSSYGYNNNNNGGDGDGATSTGDGDVKEKEKKVGGGRAEAGICFFLQAANTAEDTFRALKSVYHPKNLYVVHLDAKIARREHVELKRLIDKSTRPAMWSNHNVVMMKSRSVTYTGTTLLLNYLDAISVALHHAPKDAPPEVKNWDFFIPLRVSEVIRCDVLDLRYLFGNMPKWVNLIHTEEMGYGFFASRFLLGEMQTVLDQGLWRRGGMIGADKDEDGAGKSIEVIRTSGEESHSKMAIDGIENPPFEPVRHRATPKAGQELGNGSGGLRMFKGSVWMTLSREFCAYLQDGEDGFARDVMALLSRGYALEESYFQTVALNSRFRDTVIPINLRYNAFYHPNTFERCATGYHSCTIDMTHMPWIINSANLFIAKFTMAQLNAGWAAEDEMEEEEVEDEEEGTAAATGNDESKRRSRTKASRNVNNVVSSVSGRYVGRDIASQHEAYRVLMRLRNTGGALSSQSGDATHYHIFPRVCETVCSHLNALPPRTRALVDFSRQLHPDCPPSCARKWFNTTEYRHSYTHWTAPYPPGPESLSLADMMPGEKNPPKGKGEDKKGTGGKS